MNAAELAGLLIRRFEGLRLHPYLDSIGVPTIAYGATYYKDGQHVTLQDAPVTKEAANDLLDWMIQTVYLPHVLNLCPALDTDGRVAAITSFAFNCGLKNLEHSTLRRRINAKRWDNVPGELNKWNKAGGIVLPGLTMRRAAEARFIW